MTKTTEGALQAAESIAPGPVAQVKEVLSGGSSTSLLKTSDGGDVGKEGKTAI